ncbi:hypothetical protein LWI28_019788 [Acer negundo]|uniref:Uncharacterized protein n=1 Tax=Acer negundo TaxID=4023 RepID=A0AAD5IRI8_ACENE|nr:hypothetical protein LWI28_019788 [Acer negundo]
MFKLLEERSELGGDELRSEEDEVGFGFGYGGGIGGGGDDDDDDGRACVYGVLEQREERALRAVFLEAELDSGGGESTAWEKVETMARFNGFFFLVLLKRWIPDLIIDWI